MSNIAQTITVIASLVIVFGAQTAWILRAFVQVDKRLDRIDVRLDRIETALRPFGARPHWGKLFLAEASDLEPLYPRAHDFRALRSRLDPRGAFLNPWLEHHVLGR